MTLPEAARALGLAPATLRRQVQLHKLRARKMGARWYVSEGEVRRYRAENLGKRKGAS
jgi:excisionase family DNA binding protein